MEGRMKKTGRKKVSLGDLVVALFEETKTLTKNRKEQSALVYIALKDLLGGNRNHLMAIKA